MIKFTIRKGTDADLPLSYEIMKNALGEYVVQTWGWDEEWQWEHHRSDFDPAILSIIEVNGEAAAMLEEIIEPNTIRVCGIYIIDKYQSAGIGGQLMRGVIEKAKISDKNVELKVLKVNLRAKNFYERLGFVMYGEDENHYLMIYKTIKI